MIFLSTQIGSILIFHKMVKDGIIQSLDWDQRIHFQGGFCTCWCQEIVSSLRRIFHRTSWVSAPYWRWFPPEWAIQDYSGNYNTDGILVGSHTLSFMFCSIGQIAQPQLNEPENQTKAWIMRQISFGLISTDPHVF